MRSLPRSTARLGTMLALGMMLVALPVLAADKKADAAKTADAKKPAISETKAVAKLEAAPKPNAAMAEMMKAGAPGPEHQKLAVMAGKWKAVTKSWTGPGEPTVTEGTCDNAVILGGRFIQQSVKSEVMGMPFEGYGLTGYDNLQKTYTFVWVDNMGTMMMSGQGNMNEAGDLVMNSTAPGPDGKPMQMKLITKIVDPTKHVFSIYGVMPDGKDQLMMETTYTKM